MSLIILLFFPPEFPGLPIAWLPLEVWWSGTLSTHSSPFSIDVWSYGVLLWEIFTLGRVPYERELEEAANSQYFNNRRSQGGGGGGGKKATKHGNLGVGGYLRWEGGTSKCR